ncbi:MAG TPA: prenyltransferase/squalene oxidase repeat-containing protein [Planctomycetaceae bacterium]|nr:prenyltransferase/squalene oxidase repeat-containing protein [Planctomycetaceae bacterium]
MTHDAPPTFIDRLAELLGLSREQFDQALWIVLLAGALLSLVYLVTMLVTRWGDRHATSKALMFSVLAHLVLAVGWVTMTRNLLFVEGSSEDSPPPEFREITIESDEPVELPEDGNTPVWEKLPAPLDAELARLDRTLPEFEPPQTLERRPEDVTRPEIEIPDLTTRPDEPILPPELKNDGQAGPFVAAAIPLKVENPEPLVTPEVDAPGRPREREPILRDSAVEPEVERHAPQAAPDRMRPDFEPDRTLQAINARLDPRSFLRRGPDEESVTTPATAAPVPTDAPHAGSPQPVAEPNPDGGSLAASRSRLVPTRAPGGRADGDVERLRPSDVPTSPTPSSDRAVAVRDSVLPDLPGHGVSEPNVIRPDFTADRAGPTTTLPPTYRLRRLATRRETAIRNGGSDESERAVEASLAWLARIQEPDGRWDADRHGAGQIQLDAEGRDTRGATQVDGHTGSRSDSGVTALATLAFLGAGYTHEEGRYATTVNRAIDWLISQQDEEGCLSGEATHYARMYCHAMATYALGEAYGMQSDPTFDARLRRPLERAVEYIVQRQNPDGGWRYRVGTQSDMSMFGWQVMALKSAEIAGVRIPKAVNDKMVGFLVDRSLGANGGLAAYGGYGDSNQPTPTMTAEALFCKQMLGLPREHRQSTEAVEYLLRHIPRRSEWNEYYWYYGTMAAYHYGGGGWRQWNEPLRELLVAEQRRTGEHIGSWDPVGPWGQYGGRVYSTAVATLCLEVYYRFLPLYQHTGPEAKR